MTLTIEISAEEEARLREQAQRRGQELEAVAGAFVRAGLTSEATTPEAARAAFVGRLLAQGIIPAVPEGRPGPPPRPVPVQGWPVSETLVEERR